MAVGRCEPTGSTPVAVITAMCRRAVKTATSRHTPNGAAAACFGFIPRTDARSRSRLPGRGCHPPRRERPRAAGLREAPTRTAVASGVAISVREEAMRQDDRAPFVRALQRARVSAYAPGEFVEQEGFMRAGEIRALADRAGVARGVSVLDLCCGVAGPGRFITGSWVARIWGSTSAPAPSTSRATRPRPSLSIRGPPDPPAPTGPVRRRAPVRDDARVSRQANAAPRDIPGAADRRSVRVYHRRGPTRSRRQSERGCLTPTRFGSRRSG